MSEQEKNAGFAEEHTESVAAEPKERPKAKPSKSAEMKKNFQAVFGHGVGKLSLIAGVVAVIALIALGVNGLSSKEKLAGGEPAKVDSPRAPQPQVSVGPVSESEAARRAQVSAKEAQDAQANGTSYQPGFDPNIVANATTANANGQSASFNVPGVPTTPANPQDGQIRVGAGQSANQQGANNRNTNSGQSANKANADAIAKEEARIQAELDKATAARDKYVSELRASVLKQVEGLMGASEGSKGFTEKSSFSSVSYYPTEKRTVDENGNVDINKANADKEKDPNAIETVGNRDQKLLIKTGKIMYATLDSEINTDDGGDVLGTVQGGKWAGSKLIGKIEQGPNNIRARFTTLAPQDDRPTMRINAVALREEDAKQGIAETIDSHTGERYFALGAASLLSGYGRAYQQTAGTTVISPGGVVAQTTTEPSTKQVIGTSVGEMGSAIASEVRRGFNRPTTYATPANKGFGLFFLQDVHEQSR